MVRSRFTHADAMTFWRARDLYRAQQWCWGVLLLFFVLEFAMFATHGALLIGLGVLAVQWAALRCLGWLVRWGLWWLRRGVWWAADRVQMALRVWWQTWRP